MLLSDLRVLDLTDERGDIGPWLLGRLGAEVIKVEPPGGCPTRSLPPFVDPTPEDGDGDRLSLHFAAYNDNKQSVVLDLASPHGRASSSIWWRGPSWCSTVDRPAPWPPPASPRPTWPPSTPSWSGCW